MVLERNLGHLHAFHCAFLWPSSQNFVAMLLFSRSRERLRVFLSFTTIAGGNHATLDEAESFIIFSTVLCRC